MEILFFLKYIDIFSVEFNASIFSQKEYKTIYGSILTIIFFILAIYKLEIMLSHAISKKNFTVTEEKDILNGEDQNISSFYLTACAGSQDNDTFIFLPLVIDNGSEFFVKYNETVSKKMGEHCYSYNLSNLIISAGSVQSDLTDGVKSLQSFIFEDINKMKIDGLTFFIDEIFIKRSDYYNPVHSKKFKIIVDNISKNSKLLSIYLQTIQIIYKSTYNFGFIKYEPISSKNYTNYYTNTLTTSYNFGVEDIYQNIILVIYHSDWIINYTFSGFELDSALSDFGGYINICFILLKFIGKFINNYLLQKYVLKEINKGISYDNSLRKKLLKTSKTYIEKKNNLNMAESIDVKFILNKRSSCGKINDINNDNYSRVRIPINNKVNYSNLPINQDIISEQDDSKIIMGVNSKKLINSPLLKNKKEVKYEKKDEEKFKLFKNECDKICDKINNEDELYNSLSYKKKSDTEKEYIRKKINEKLFRKLMDYSNLYIIFKELKLLELLVLKPDEAKFFMEYKNKLIDFNKLMVLVENKKIQDKIFYSKLYKKYAISKCII